MELDIDYFLDFNILSNCINMVYIECSTRMVLLHIQQDLTQLLRVQDTFPSIAVESKQ